MEIVGGNFGDGNGGWFSVFFGFVFDGERDGFVNIFGVCRGVVVGRVDMFEVVGLLVIVVVV